MSEEVDKKLYAHYKSLTEGSYKSGNPVRDALVVEDAKKHLADLVRKRPNIQFEEETKELEVPEEPKELEVPEEPKEETKSKRKK